MGNTRKYEGVLDPPPRRALMPGMPLHDRVSNLIYVNARMREHALAIYDRTAPVAELDMERVADALEYYADVVETLQHHGTLGYHRKGCRCDWCEEASRQFYERYSDTLTARRKAYVERRKRGEVGFHYDEENDPL